MWYNRTTDHYATILIVYVVNSRDSNYFDNLKINKTLRNIYIWFSKNKLKINSFKSKYILFKYRKIKYFK